MFDKTKLFGRAFLWLAMLLCLVAPGSLPAQSAARGGTLPEFENEFFNDFTGSASSAQKIEISRNLRIAGENSQIHSMIVVIRKVSDYPSLPQEVHAMALRLARERRIGSQKTHQGILALFALEDRKFTVAHSGNLEPKLSETIRDTFNGRVRAKLREGQPGIALLFASEDLASLLPKAGAVQRAGAQNAQGQRPTTNPAAPALRDSQRPPPKEESGFSWVTILVVLAGGYLILSFLGRLFSGGPGPGPGMGPGYGGGGSGWGGLLGGLLGGGLLGYWLGSSSSHASDNVPDQRPNNDEGGGGGGFFGGSDSGSGDSGSGGFDTFGGGDFSGGGSDGGGSDGDW